MTMQRLCHPHARPVLVGAICLCSFSGAIGEEPPTNDYPTTGPAHVTASIVTLATLFTF